MSDEITALLHTSMPFCARFGMRGVESSPEQVVVEVDWSEDLCTTGGVLHGGVLMSLADTAGAVCAFSNLPDGASFTTTIESKTNFLRAATEGTLTVRSSPVHVGRTTIVVQTDVTRDDGKLVTRTTQTQAVLGAG